MSYILDALRRADADRERDRAAAPGLHSQEHQRIELEVDDGPLTPPIRAGRLLLIGLALAAAVAAAAWRWWPGAPAVDVAALPAVLGSEPPSATAPVQPVVAAPVASGMSQSGATDAPTLPSVPKVSDVPVVAGVPGVPPGVASVAGVAGVAVAPPAAPRPATERSSLSALTPRPASAALRTNPPPALPRLPPAQIDPAGAPLPNGRGFSGPAVQTGPAGAATSPVPATAVMPREAPPPAPTTKPDLVTQTPSAAVPLPKARELPESTRRELPPLTVSGSMYSPDAANRMIVLDGQVLREGQSAQSGLVVEQIGPKSAILSHKGLRFELPF